MTRAINQSNAESLAMVMANTNYGVTIPLEAVTAIILLIVAWIISNWWKSFSAKPETLAIRVDKIAEECSAMRSDIKDLRNKIENNTEKDNDTKKRIENIESRFYGILENITKK